MARVGVVVDSVCELPPEFQREHPLVTLPTRVQIGGRVFDDVRDPDEMARFYREHLANSHTAETAAVSAGEIEELFLQRLVIDYDYVLCMTTASARSPTYANAQKAALGILSRYQAVRAAAGVQGPFALRVMDTQNLFGAQGVLAAEALRLIAAGTEPARVREHVDALVDKAYCYLLPNSLYHIRNRAARKGDRSLGWLQYMVGSALDIKPLLRGHRNETLPVAKLRHFNEGAQRLFGFLGERLRAGLLVPVVCVSFAGPLESLHALPGYAEFSAAAAASGVRVHESQFGITAAIHVGEGSLSVGFCAPPHEFA